MAAYKGVHRRKRGPARYPDEVNTQAVEMYNKCRNEFTANEKAARHIAALLGVGSYDSVLNWVKQSNIDKGLKAGLTSNERDELRKLRRENLELKRANGILKAASAFFAAEQGGPQGK